MGNKYYAWGKINEPVMKIAYYAKEKMISAHLSFCKNRQRLKSDKLNLTNHFNEYLTPAINCLPGKGTPTISKYVLLNKFVPFT